MLHNRVREKIFGGSECSFLKEQKIRQGLSIYQNRIGPKARIESVVKIEAVIVVCLRAIADRGYQKRHGIETSENIYTVSSEAVCRAIRRLGSLGSENAFINC